jgi:UDP-GlcNAc:undecaprenyl-phosphate GlcNAc-1-phosphate transferase
MSLFVSGVSAFLLTLATVPLVMRVARARGLMALPTFDRWHEELVPNVGGIAMLVPVLVVVALAGALPEVAPLVVASTLMFGIGLVDDVRPLRPSSKLVFQTGVAALLLWWLPVLDITGVPMLDIALGFGWIVGITNAVNLLDNIDGLAAGIGAIAGACFLAVLAAGQPDAAGGLALLVAALVGATLGFLMFNFHPASIFMGDGGSHLIGALLAGATLIAAASPSQLLVPVTVVPVLLFIPIFDSAFVTLSRGLSGRSAFLGGRDHTSHRLVALGLGQRRAVLVLYALALVGGAVAIGVVALPPAVAGVLVLMYVAALVALGTYLGHVEHSREGGQPPLPTEVTTRTRAYEVLLDAVLLGTAYYLAYLVRFREPEFSALLPQFLSTFPLVLGLQLGALWLTGKYRWVWGHLSPNELASLARGTLLGVASSVIAVLYLTRFEGTSRLVFVFDGLFATGLIVGARVALTGLDQYLRVRRSRGRVALIYGAGRGGALAARELLQNETLGLTPIGFVDDDPSKRRLKVDGLPVLATLHQLARLFEQRPGGVDTVIVSVTALPPHRFDELCEICAAHGVAVRRMRFSLDPVEHPGGEPMRVVTFRRGGGRRTGIG